MRRHSEFHTAGDASDEALKYHLLFSDRETLKEAGLDYVTDEVALYNTCYWLLVYAASDVVLEVGSIADYKEQAFQFLEYATCEVDFAIVEEVWRLAEEDALE